MLLCQKLYKLATQLEKNKLIEEKKLYLEERNKKNEQKRVVFQSIENFYRDQVNLLKSKLEKEKFERKIAQNAQDKVDIFI